MSNSNRTKWGEIDGRPVYQWTMRNRNGLCSKIINYGCILTELHVPDRSGEPRDIVLGFDNLKSYLSYHPYFGSIIGRVANRTSDARFQLDGLTCILSANIDGNHIHGGFKGFDKRVWTAVEEKANVLALTYHSPNGEEGYPGALTTRLTYTLTDQNELRIDYLAEAETTTVVNLTHHGYWNLGGHDGNSVLEHELEIAAGFYTPADKQHTATGEILPVKGTALDFRTPKLIGDDIERIEFPGNTDPLGYDLNYVLDRSNDGLQFVARVRNPQSGYTMEFATTKPGMVLYTGNYLDGTCIGKNDMSYTKQTGFCLEAQHFPDVLNKSHLSGWPSVQLRPGESYRHTDLFRFSTT